MIGVKAWFYRLRAGGIERNSVFSLLQAGISTLCMFGAYRLVIAQDGLASLGLWSLLMVFGGMAMTFDVSGASALTRFISRHELEFADTTPAVVVHTVLLTSMAINAVLVLVLLGLAPFVLPTLVAPDQLALAWMLTPWVATAMLVTPLAIGVMSSIDGVMRADQRAVLVALSAACGLAFAWIAIPRFGVVGLAMAQCVQQATIIAGGWVVLRLHIADLGWGPVRWRLPVFRRTSGFAIKLNALGVLILLNDPLAKYCINLIGGTIAVGTYELASRLALTLRNFVASAASPTIPAFAKSNGSDDIEFVNLLSQSLKYSPITSLIFTISCILGAPIMSIIILGEVSTDLVTFNALLAFGWSINIIAMPLYLAAHGQGLLRWNMASSILIGLAVISATAFLGPTQGSAGVVVGVTSGLLVGAAVTIIGNARAFAVGHLVKHKLPLMGAIAAINGIACSVVAIYAEPIAARLANL